MHFQKQKNITALLILLTTTFFMTNCNNLAEEQPQQQSEQTNETVTSLNITGAWFITGLIRKNGETEEPPAGTETLFTFNSDNTYNVSFKRDSKQGTGYSGTYKLMPDSVLHTYYVMSVDSIHDLGKIILFEQSSMQIKDMNAEGDIMIFTRKK